MKAIADEEKKGDDEADEGKAKEDDPEDGGSKKGKKAKAKTKTPIRDPSKSKKFNEIFKSLSDDLQKHVNWPKQS